MATLVSIVIPTFRRPGPLARALASALAQELNGVTAEIVVVDNDPEGSARGQAEAAMAGAPMTVRYVHAPQPGVANARNAGVNASHGRFLAFLDDDEVAPANWLQALLAAQRRFDADVVFGPVKAFLPAGPMPYRRYLTDFFSRMGPASAGVIDAPYGCGCSLVRWCALPDPVRPFSAERNGIGGEDDLLFAAMKARGARFAWAPDAWVWEQPEPRRLTLAYTLQRAFAYGQGPCASAFAAGVWAWPAIPFWMAVGVAQALAYGARAAVEAAIRSPDLACTLDRAARGLGKLLWFPPFKIGFYGRAALQRAGSSGDRHERHQSLELRSGERLLPGDPEVPAHA